MKTKSAKKDPRFNAYIAACNPFARPILKHLRKVVHQACPKATETMKWGMPTFLYNQKILCGIAGFKAHCGFWFWNGSSVMKGVAKKTGAMGNFGRITNIKDLPSSTILKKIVKYAMQLNEAGLAKKKSKKKK